MGLGSSKVLYNNKEKVYASGLDVSCITSDSVNTSFIFNIGIGFLNSCSCCLYVAIAVVFIEVLNFNKPKQNKQVITVINPYTNGL